MRWRASVLVIVCALATASIAAQEPDPEREALRARVEQIHENPDLSVRGVHVAARRTLSALYEHRGFARAWSTPAARADLLRAVRESANDGLDPEDYLLSTLEKTAALAEAADAPLEARIDYDVLLTDALARLLYHLIFGKVDPRDYDPHWNFTREIHDLDPPRFLQDVIDSGEVYARIEREKPSHRMYTALRSEFAHYRELAAQGGFPVVPAGATLEKGADGTRVAALRARLAASGDLPSGADSTDAFDSALEEAVRAFQRRVGIDDDGRVGAATQVALDVPIESTIEQIRVNLERGRWLLHDLAPTFVVVNVAGFRVYYLRNGELVWSTRAMVGKPFRQTPLFRSKMTYLVLNPTWTVPPSILANDILPAQRRNPSYLEKRGLRVIDANGREVPISSIDWSRATARSFPYMLRQDAGPDNALGRIKFMFPNSYAVYLHDTPNRELFGKSERAQSSGCIRVENPLELAALLLEDQSGWDRAKIDRAVDEGTTRTVTLAQQVPVLLTYWTAWVDSDGKLQLRRDVYGRDPQVARALAEPFRIRARPAVASQ